MSSFDVTLNVIGISAHTPEAEDGTTPHVMLSATVGHILPISTDGQQPMVLPLGTVRFALDKEAALGTAKRLQEEGEKLAEEKESDILIASDLSQVEKAAEKIRGVTGT